MSETTDTAAPGPKKTFKIWVANTTRQNQDFNYALPYPNDDGKIRWSPRIEKIPAGNQVELAAGHEFPKSEVDIIVKHGERYGLRHHKDVSKGHKGLLFSTDGPIPLEKIMDALEGNDAVAQERSDEILMNTAAGVADKQQKLAASAGTPMGVRADIEVVDVPREGGLPAVAKGAEATSEGVEPKRSRPG